MRKIISVLALVSLLAFLLVPIAASAQVLEECKLRHDVTDVSKMIDETATCDEGVTLSGEDFKTYAMCCMVDSVYTVTDWIFMILMVIVGLMIAIGAFTIMTAAGAPEKVTAGRNYILYAVIGMIVAFFARAIPYIVKMVIGA